AEFRCFPIVRRPWLRWASGRVVRKPLAAVPPAAFDAIARTGKPSVALGCAPMSARTVPFPLGVLGLTRVELRRVAPVALSYSALLAAIYVLKPARNTLFLDVVGVSRLPWVLLGVAVLGAALAWLLTRAARTASVVKLLPR